VKKYEINYRRSILLRADAKIGSKKVRIYFWLYLNNYRTDYYNVDNNWKRKGLVIFRNRC